MIKVAHIVTSYSSVVTILRTKLARLAALDDLSVSVISAPPTDEHRHSVSPVPYIAIPMARSIHPLMDCLSIWRLRRALRRGRFDIVHTHTAKAGVLGAIAARLAGVPVILHTYHGMPYYEGQPAAQYRRYLRIEQLACRWRHHVLSQNRRDLIECERLMGSLERASYEGNGVDMDALDAVAKTGREPAEADFPPGEVRVAMFARLEPVKRVGDFLAACRQLVESGVKLSAVIAGTGDQEHQVQQEVESLGLAQHVRLLGWVTNGPAVLAASDVVTLTSEKEGMPRVIMEAMALGKPVVATDVLGTQELVVDGETGYLTPLADPRALADRIQQLASDASLRERFGQAGRRRIEAEFNDIRIAAFLRDFYNKMMAERGGIA